MSEKLVEFYFESTDLYEERIFADCKLCLQKMDSHNMAFVQRSDGHNFCRHCFQYLMMQIALKRIRPEKTTGNEQKGESRTEADGEPPRTTEVVMEPLMSLYTKAHGKRVVIECSMCSQMLDSFVEAIALRDNGDCYCPGCCMTVMAQLVPEEIVKEVGYAKEATNVSEKLVKFAFKSTNLQRERIFANCSCCLRKMDSYSVSFVQCSNGTSFCEKCYGYLRKEMAPNRIPNKNNDMKTTRNERKREKKTRTNVEQPQTAEVSIADEILSVTNVNNKRLVTKCFSCKRKIDSFFDDVFRCDTQKISFCAQCVGKCKVEPAPQKDVPVGAVTKVQEQTTTTTATAPLDSKKEEEEEEREEEEEEEDNVREQQSPPPPVTVAPSHFCASCKKQSSFAEIRVCITCATAMNAHQDTEGTPKTDPIQMKEWHFCSNCVLDFHINKGHHQERLKDSAMLHQRLESVQDCSMNIQSLLGCLKSSMREREENYKMISMICELVNKEANNLSARELSEIYHIFSEILPLSVRDKDVQQRMTMNRKAMMLRIPLTIAERVQREKTKSFTPAADIVESEVKIRELEQKCKLLENCASKKNKRNGGGETAKAQRALEEQLSKMDIQKSVLEEQILSIQSKLKTVEAKEAKGRETIQTLREKMAFLETEDKKRLRVWTAENIQVLVDAIRKQDEQQDIDEGAVANLNFNTGCVRKFPVSIPSEVYWQRDGVIVSLKETLCLTHIGLYKQSRDVGILKARVRVYTNRIVFSDFMVQIPYAERVDDNVHLVELPRKVLMLNTARYYFELTFDRPAKLWWGFGGAGKMDIPGFPGNKITFSLQDTAFEGQIPEFHFTDQLITKQKKNRITTRRKQ